jgi:AraC family transcriptional regulator, melibiose operon regulatory protein
MVLYMELSVLEDLSEIIHYEDPNIPIYVKIGHLSAFPERKVLGH